MKKSSTLIINHIPRFLDYCKKIGLTSKTQETYERLLNRFILWLKKENKNNLLPQDLTIDDIKAYKLHLTHSQNSKNHFPLKKKTQNYYLIALRALLSYFTLKDIVSIPAVKISLLYDYDTKREKTMKILTLDQIKKLLLSPNTKTIIGLRDKAILGTLISTGLKVNQLRNLDRDQIEGILSKEVSVLVDGYLKTRNDKNKALFINYKGPRNSIGGRLTNRSIENIVKRYGEIIGLPFSITPEILRWARVRALLDAEIKIQEPHSHKIFITENYKCTIIQNKKRKNIQYSLFWHTVENVIDKEIMWLKNNIPVLSEKYKENPPFLKCDDCILRKIAILIVSGSVKVIEFQAEKGKDLWNNLTENSNFTKISKHGQEWHRKMMDMISKYFKDQNYKVIFEPILNYGRADLGIYLKQNKVFYIEIGTVSLFKFWYNLSTMKNITFLLIPSENYAIEFKI